MIIATRQRSCRYLCAFSCRFSWRCGCCTRVRVVAQGRPGGVKLIGSWLANSSHNLSNLLKMVGAADGRYPVNDAEEVYVHNWTEPPDVRIRNGPFISLRDVEDKPPPIRWWRCRKMVPVNQRSSNCWRACWLKPVWLRSMEKILMILNQSKVTEGLGLLFQNLMTISFSTRPFNERWSGVSRAGHGWPRHDYEAGSF